MILRNIQITTKSWDVIEIHRLIVVIIIINILILTFARFTKYQIEQISLEFKLRALQDHPDKNSNSLSARIL